ncbi:hypothetical protein QNH98_11120 [Myroides sp. mNGS23_01]|nr:hypothetical protein [Myroides sp. mNGS23_01]WHT37720.1 hypothetical protein QNH98_11120 [Myroides sp. mNGS23_01]
MEWSKIDQEWKKQLDERSIAPSARAWDQLTKQLDDRDKKKTRSALTLGIGIAACLVVGGIMGLIFGKQSRGYQLTQPIAHQQNSIW